MSETTALPTEPQPLPGYLLLATRANINYCKKAKSFNKYVTYVNVYCNVYNYSVNVNRQILLRSNHKGGSKGVRS